MLKPFLPISKTKIAITLSLTSLLTIPLEVKAITLKITLENLTPPQGAIVTPLWFGFHDGSFNTFDAGALASTGIEHIAEDGYTGLESQLPGFEGLGFDPNNFVIPLDNTISGLFANSQSSNGGVQGILSTPDNPFIGFFPEEVNSTLIKLNGKGGQNRYFSFAAMFFPSNDAFIADQNPIEIFDINGNFRGADFLVSGNQVWDAGTEVNDESLANVPFTLPQIAQGVTETEAIQLHPGFLPAGSGGILDFFGGSFLNSDPTTPNYSVARIRIEQVPEPNLLNSLGAVGIFCLVGLYLRQRY